MPRKGKGDSPKPLRGYRRLKSGRWETPKGYKVKEISDYEYRSRVAKKYGWKNYSEYKKYQRRQPYLITQFDVENNPENYDDKGKYIGPDMSYQFTRDVFTVERRRQEKEAAITTYGQRRRADESDLGRMLIALGKIPIDYEWEYA